MGRGCRARGLRIALLAGGIPAGVAGLALLVLVVLLAVPSTCTWMARQGLGPLNRLLPGAEVELDRLRLGLVTGLDVQGLRITGEDEREYVAISAVSARWRGVELLAGRVHVTRIRLEEPRVDLRALEDGRVDLLVALGLGDAPPPEEPAGPWGGVPVRIDVDAVELEGGFLSWYDGTSRWLLQELDLEGALAAEDRRAHLRRLLVAGAVALQRPDQVSLNTRTALKGAVSYRDGDLHLDGLRGRLGGVALSLDGDVARVETAPELDLSLAAKGFRPSEFSGLLGETGVRGAFDLELEARGPLDALQAQAGVLTPAGTVALGLGADLVSDPLRYRARIGLGALSPHRFVDAVTEPVVLEGELAVEGSGTSWPEGITASGDIRLEPGVVWGQPMDGLSARLALSEGVIRVDDLRLATALARAAGQVRVRTSDWGVDARLSLREARLHRLEELGVEGIRGRGAADVQVTARFPSSGPRVEIQGELDVSGVAYGGYVEAGRAAGPASLAWGPQGMVLSGELEASDVRSFGAAAAHLAGPWEVRLEEGAVSWRASPELEGVLYPPAEVANLSLDVEGSVQEEVALHVDFIGQQLVLETMASPGLEGHLDLEGDALAMTLRGWEGERAVVQARLDFDLSGGDLVAEELLLAPNEAVHWESVRPARIRVDEEGFHGVDLAFSADPGAEDAARMQVTGDLPFEGDVDLSVRIVDVTLDPLVGLVPGLPLGLEGRTHLELAVSGAAQDLDVQGEARVRDLVVPGAVRDLDADLSVEGGGGTVALSLRLPVKQDKTKTSQGGVAPHLYAVADATVPLTLTLGEPVLAMDEPWSMDLVLSPGALDRWEALLHEVELPEADVSGHLRVGGTPRQSTVALAGLVEMPLGSSGSRFRLDYRVEQRGDTLQAQASIWEGMEKQADLDAGARTRMAEVVRANVEGALPAGPSRGPGPSVDPGPPPDPGTVATWVDELEVSLVPLGIPTEVLAGIVDLPEALAARLMGGLRITGDPLEPEVTGGLQLVDARIGDMDLAPATVTIIPEEGGYEVAAMLGFGDEGSLDIEGFVPAVLDFEQTERITSQEGLHLMVGGDGVPLSAVASLVSDLEFAEGNLILEGTVEGRPDAPKMNLDLDIQDGLVGWRSSGIRYDDVHLRASVRDRLFRLEHLRAETRPLQGGAMSQSGRFNVGGTVRLEEWRPAEVSLRARAERMWIADTPMMRLALSGETAVQGSWPALGVTGDFTFNQARLVADRAVWLYSGTLELDPALTIHRSVGRDMVRDKPEGPPWYDDIDVDLDVDLGRSTWVEVRMPLDDRFGSLYATIATMELEAQLDGVLDVGFSGGEPALRGEVEPVRGRAEILGANFDLSEGKISFVGGDPYDPILDVTAVHDAGEYGEVEVDIGGSLEDLDLSFSSEDYPDETDVVSILLLGRPTSELSGEEGQSNDQLLQVAAGALVGELETALGGSIADMVQVDTTSSGSVGAVRVGYSLGDDVFLILEVRPEASDTEDENLRQATVEWTVSRHWIVEVVTGDRGASSLDLFRTWRF